MLSRAVLLSFSSMLGICTASFGMEQPHQDKMMPTLSLQEAKVLSSSQELYLYGNKFFEAINNDDYQLILDLAFPEPIFPSTCSHSDIESYLYNRTSALFFAYNELAEKSGLNPKAAIKQWVSILKEVNNYLKAYGSFESSHNSMNINMLWHRFFIYYQAGESYFAISALKSIPGYPVEQRTSALKNAMAAYENALIQSDKFLKLPFCQGPIDGISHLLPIIKFNLLSLCCNLAQLVEDKEAPLLLKKARKIYRESQSQWDKHILEEASSALETARKIIEYNQLPLAPVGTKRVQTTRTLNYLKIQNDIIDTSGIVNSQAYPIHLLSIIVQQKNWNLNGLCASQPNVYDQSAAKIREGLIDIETTVASSLKLAPSSSLSREQLAIIYEHLTVLLDPKEMIATFWKYIPAFIDANDIEGGIHRVDLLIALEVKENGAASYLIRLIAAGMKNLQGDHEDWLSLEADLKAEVQEKKQHKLAVKERNEQQRLDALRLSITEKQNKKPVEVAVNKQVRPIVQTQQKHPITEPDVVVIEDNSISHKDSKLEKQKRHEEAELRRLQNAKSLKVNHEQKQAQSETNTPKISKEMKLEAILASSDKTLSELYNLSSLPLKIDQEIEQETWQFTRDQFQIYLEAMGCIYKSGHGAHTKASLPKAMHVMQGDNLITILSDFGGALTLPLWDKDYVPVYLRTQILEARKKLIALKIKALNYKVNEDMSTARLS